MDATSATELSLMLEDNAQARVPFAVTGPVWPRLRLLFRDKLKTSIDLHEFNNHFASYAPDNRHYEGYARHLGATGGDWYQEACARFLERLRERDQWDVLNQTKQNITWDYLSSVEEITSILSVQPKLATDPLVVVDLGSGWGRIGHVLTTLNPKLTYVACDIPESLIIAQEHLPKCVTVPVHRYSEARAVERFDRTLAPGVWFCGTQHLDRFVDASVDVFINTFSFQEMSMEQVVGYFAVVDRVAKGGLLYTQQRKQGDEMTQENYPYLPAWKLALDREAVFFPAYFEAAFWV